jgi:carbon monoxide dehydrogenase subunit G
MKMTEEIRIEAPREQVFAALNDPDILRQAIPGCQELEKISDTELAATVQAKVGPVKAKFKGQVTLSDINAPESYTISGEGKGGAAGFAKGSAKVHLAEDGAATILSYEVDAEVGGKLAQIGSRLIEGTSKKLAGEFFDAFSALVAPADAAAEAESEAPAPMEAPAPEAVAPKPGGISPMVWMVGGAIALALGIWLLTQ